jgi:hypothetical protein
MRACWLNFEFIMMGHSKNSNQICSAEGKINSHDHHTKSARSAHQVSWLNLVESDAVVLRMLPWSNVSTRGVGRQLRARSVLRERRECARGLIWDLLAWPWLEGIWSEQIPFGLTDNVLAWKAQVLVTVDCKIVWSRCVGSPLSLPFYIGIDIDLGGRVLWVGFDRTVGVRSSLTSPWPRSLLGIFFLYLLLRKNRNF